TGTSGAYDGTPLPPIDAFTPGERAITGPLADRPSPRQANANSFHPWRSPRMASPSTEPETTFTPYVADGARLKEFTWSAVLAGAVLGIVFGASSLYLMLKVGMTVSASVPIAVLSITLFRAFSKTFGIRNATILENNIVQTTGSAGESIAFGVGATMP